MSDTITITLEEYSEWATLPATKDFVLSLQDEQATLVTSILNSSPDFNREQLIGMVKGIDTIIDKIKSLRGETR